MKKCMYCKKELNEKYLENKIGLFCSEEHYTKYLDSLSNEEYIAIQNNFCVCSDD
ncbi:hypothetical protein ACQPUY_09410 [Clostridium nigeriense]|uniref:hypothetical protein n=1 Tax=Clostridium nigeriense TaxID=1805470 RepID=UPI003D34212D